MRPLARVNRVTLPIQISPSVLPADFSKLGDEVRALEEAGVDLIQWDVMDGQFVPNLTFGPDVIAAARKHTSLPFEAHLMVLTPDVMAARYVDAGCSRLIVHAEACTHLHRTCENIRSMGASAAVALNPHTPASVVEHVLDLEGRQRVLFVDASHAAGWSDAECFRVTRLRPGPQITCGSHAMRPDEVLRVWSLLKASPPPPCWLLAIRGYRFALGEEVSDAAQRCLRHALVWAKSFLQSGAHSCANA